MDQGRRIDDLIGDGADPFRWPKHENVTGNPDVNPSITLKLFQQMVLCQLTRGLAMIASGILITLRPRRMLIVSQWCFLSGTTIHSIGAIANLLWSNPWFSMASMTEGFVILLGWLALVEGGFPGCQRTCKADPSCRAQ